MHSDPSHRPPALLVAASLHRSGSTLVQRYVTAASDIFVWGENGFLLQSLKRAFDSWPQAPHDERRYHDAVADPTVVERTFSPNISPPVDRVTDVFRRTVASIYRDVPDGFERWGWKDVGYGRADIEFVRTLFPDLDVVLLVRDPWHVARSIRRKGWIDRRGYFEDMEQVATHWAERTAEYVELASGDDERLLLVRYEELDRRIGELKRFIGVDRTDTTWSDISRRTLGTAPTWSRFDFTTRDAETVERVAGDIAAGLGYSPPVLGASPFGVFR